MSFTLIFVALVCFIMYFYLGVFVLWIEQDCYTNKYISIYNIIFNKICRRLCKKYPALFKEDDGEFTYNDKELNPHTSTSSISFNRYLNTLNVVTLFTWPVVLSVECVRMAIKKEK